jgi:glycosyltransferase involved in cell wall biosynthesis
VLFVIYNIPYIITEHWTRYLPGNNTFNGFLRKKITQLVVSKAKAVTVVTKNLETAMKQHGLKNNNYKLIYNVVNTYKFRIIENLEQPPKKRIIHISNFYDRNKNIVGILKCMKELSRTRNDFECYCIGINEGDTTDYADVAHKMGILNSVVFFRGLLQAERIAEEFNQSCFFVLYSNFENLPVVMLESWACGLPVLVTNVGGISEHVNSKLGVMVEPKDDTAFIKALNYMLDNYKTYNKVTIREYALQHFSEQTISKQLDELYKLTMTPVKC